MSESLLSFSEVLLFGRLIHDIGILEPVKVKTAYEAADNAIPSIGADDKLGTVKVATGDLVLLQLSETAFDKNGIYTVAGASGSLTLGGRATIDRGMISIAKKGGEFRNTIWRQKKKKVGEQLFVYNGRRRRGKGNNNFLGDQLGDDARLARIYGFSYEGTFYELPEPCIFLVHGNGESATDKDLPDNQAARAPLDPSVSGVAAADYQIANEIRVWDYDKADYTLRMDVLTGQFEQILLDIYFEFDAPGISGAKVSGAKVSGAKVSGAKVSGAKVSGAKVSGAKVSGAKARGD